MHRIQENLLKLAQQQDLGHVSLREIGRILGGEHPWKVRHHLDQLAKKGFVDKKRRVLNPSVQDHDTDFVIVPVVGSANCGPATIFAEQNVEGYLKVSKRILKPHSGLYAIKAVGDSMNRAKIGTKTIESGDYVIIDSNYKKPENNDYVLSVIDGVCNIKKFSEDRENNQVVLFSESNSNYPPICIHPDESSYMVCGKVVEVIKSQNNDY